MVHLSHAIGSLRRNPALTGSNLNWRGLQVCLEGMIKQRYGKIVNITSQSEVIATKSHATCEGSSHPKKEGCLFVCTTGSCCGLPYAVGCSCCM